jgi:hypothetical protein
VFWECRDGGFVLAKFDFRFSIFEFRERATARGRIGHLALTGLLQIDPATRAMVTVLIVLLALPWSPWLMSLRPRPTRQRVTGRAGVAADALACSRSILDAGALDPRATGHAAAPGLDHSGVPLTLTTNQPGPKSSLNQDQSREPRQSTGNALGMPMKSLKRTSGASGVECREVKIERSRLVVW